jgi:sigma-B regulation protein RsbU (phosphoserine phosphatase)
MVETPGTWIGARRDIGDVTSDSALQLRDGDILLLYTDGVTEARDAKGELFDLERLTEIVVRARDKLCEQIVADVVAGVKAWMSEQADDISLMAIRYHDLGFDSDR